MINRITYSIVLIVMLVSCDSPIEQRRQIEKELGEQQKNHENKIDSFDKVLEKASNATDYGRISWQKPGVVLSKLKNLEGSIVADIGAGTGFFTFRLLYKAKKVIAVDIDPMMIQHLNSVILSHPRKDLSKKIETRLASANDPKLTPNEVDKILIINTIAYLPSLKDYLKNLKSALKENGQLLIVDFKMKRLPEGLKIPKSERLYPDKIEEMLYLLGFKNIIVDDTSLDYQYIISAST